MQDFDHTQFVNLHSSQEPEVSEILRKVYFALDEKGYNAVSQIVGYIMSGDPTYITSHNNARSLIMRVERDEIVEELLRNYIETNFENGPKSRSGRR